MDGIFDFDLVTVIRNHMFHIIDRKESMDSNRLVATRLHFEALKLVVAEDHNGVGGECGQEKYKSLQKAYQKYA